MRPVSGIKFCMVSRRTAARAQIAATTPSGLDVLSNGAPRTTFCFCAKLTAHERQLKFIARSDAENLSSRDSDVPAFRRDDNGRRPGNMERSVTFPDPCVSPESSYRYFIPPDIVNSSGLRLDDALTYVRTYVRMRSSSKRPSTRRSHRLRDVIRNDGSHVARTARRTGFPARRIETAYRKAGYGASRFCIRQFRARIPLWFSSLADFLDCSSRDGPAMKSETSIVLLQNCVAEHGTVAADDPDDDDPPRKRERERQNLTTKYQDRTLSATLVIIIRGVGLSRGIVAVLLGCIPGLSPKRYARRRMRREKNERKVWAGGGIPRGNSKRELPLLTGAF